MATTISIFVSYSRRDRVRVRTIVESLVRAGFLVWFDQNALLPGDNWQEKIRQAIAGSDVVLFMVSPDSVISTNCLIELEITQTLRLPIIPVNLRDDVRLPPALHNLDQIHFADFSEGETQENIEQLSEGIRKIVENRSGPPISQQLSRETISRQLPAFDGMIAEEYAENAPTEFTLSEHEQAEGADADQPPTGVDLGMTMPNKVPEPPPSPRPDPHVPAWLEGVAGEVDGQSYPIDEQTLTCGRLRRNHIQLLHPRVSRQHFVIWSYHNTYYIENLSTALGTFVNGHRVNNHQILNDHDRIRVHEAEFVFRKSVR